ncbi:MAG: hypothetical protein DRJ01_05760 [Bacteroidetes bacterium]|nr:MAG: hypothetical protein DRJ01_05760 [Bacteroidota bacterium]
MKQTKFHKLFLLSFLLTGLFLISCDYISENNSSSKKDTTNTKLLTDNEVVELKDAKFVDAEILMGAGKLTIFGGAENLLDASFEFSDKEFKADIKYEVSEEEGKLKISQPSSDIHFNIQNDSVKMYKNIWDLRFNKDVPMNMLIKFGAGKADVHINQLLVEKLDLELGAGKASIDLNNSKVLKSVDVEMGVGDLTLDLSGDWNHNLFADIEGGIGKLTLILPEKVGVKAKIEKGITDVNVDNFVKKGKYYYNESFNEDKPFIEIEINTGIGQINLVTR